jgi:hypothetical protein
MTRIEAANARRTEAEAAMAACDYAEAARCYTWAAEQHEAIWWEMHRSTKCPTAIKMRALSVQAIRLRDAVAA